MPKIIISGIGGQMGSAIRTVIKENSDFKDFEVVAGFDVDDGEEEGVPVFSRPEEAAETAPRADVVIDFSNYAFVGGVMRYCDATNTPAVIATTALEELDIKLMSEVAKQTPIFHSANMSLGVNLIAKMARIAAPAVEDGFNIEIIEAHHNRKKDSPSGTAILLADAINDSLRERKEYVFGRCGREDEPSISEIGIHAVRGGTIPGQHTIMFAGPDEVIEISHMVYSRKVFAIGALKAAEFILGKEPGLYDMNDLLG